MIQALWSLDQQFQNKNGSILTHGKIYVYYSGRTALATTYSDEDGTVVNPNPIILDNNGRAACFASSMYAYTVVVCDAYGKELFSYDITLHDAIGTAEKVFVIGSDGSVQVETTTLPNGVQYDLSVNTDIIATNESVENVSSNIQTKLDKKKDLQEEKSFSGSKTKTITNLSQNANGVITVNYEDIDLPQEVPNVEITSVDKSIQVTETTDVQTNTKKFDLSLNVDDPLEYGQFRATNVTSNAQLTKINGNLELNNYTIKLKKGNSYHFTVRGSYVANNPVNTNSTIVYIEYSSFTPIQVNVDNTITDAQFFEISYDVYKLSSDKNYNVAFSSIDGGKVSELWVEVHNLNGVSVNGQGGGSGTTYTAGDGIDLTNDTISVKYSKGLEINSDNQLQVKAGSGLTFDDTGNLTTVSVIPTKTSELENDSGFFNTDDIHNGRTVILLTPLQKYSNYLDTNYMSTRFSGYIDNILRIALFGTSIHITNSFTPVYSPSDGIGTSSWPAIAYFEIPNFVADNDITSITSISNMKLTVAIQCKAGSNKFAVCLSVKSYASGWYDLVTIPIMF